MSSQNLDVRNDARNNDARNSQIGGKKPRGRFWRGLGIVSLVVVGGGVAWGTLTQNGRDFAEAAKTGVPTMIAVNQNPTLIFDQAGSDHVNILLIGRDVNYKSAKVYDPTTKTYRPFHVVDKDSPARSDSMIVMSLDKSKGTMRLVSVPRDAMVRLSANDYHVKRAKLNAAHAYGGPKLLIQTLHDELGLTIHHFAVIKFDGFKKLIDDVGGVEINVEGALLRDKETGKLYRGNLKYDDNWGNLHQNLKPGLQTLDGQQAHDYVRFREDVEGDTGRMRRQQGVMRALAKKIMHASPFKIPTLIKSLRQQFDTDLTDEQLASAAYFTRGLNSSTKIQPITLFGVYSTRGSLTLNRPKNEKLLAAIFGSTFDKNSFLVRSPSTDEDEIGVANDSNAGAQEVLREAGLVKAGDAKNQPADDVDTSPFKRAPLSNPSPDSSVRDASTISSTRNASNDAAHSRRDAASNSESSPPRDTIDANTRDSNTRDNSAPDNRVVIASTDSSRANASDADSTPPPRHRRRRHRAAPDSSPDSVSKRSSRNSTASERSPIPIPENASSQDTSSRDNYGSDSPIPRAE